MGSQGVTLKYERPPWGDFLTSSQNIIYAQVDVRGTGGRGLRFMNALYKKLGNVEVKDTIAAARKMTELPFIDGNKMCVFGWVCCICLFLNKWKESLKNMLGYIYVYI